MIALTLPVPIHSAAAAPPDPNSGFKISTFLPSYSVSSLRCATGAYSNSKTCSGLEFGFCELLGPYSQNRSSLVLCFFLCPSRNPTVYCSHSKPSTTRELSIHTLLPLPLQIQSRPQVIWSLTGGAGPALVYFFLFRQSALCFRRNAVLQHHNPADLHRTQKY
ncbi:hypothetical protein B0H14DRAFT_1099780 [Mycena olivaceomarginata]|nr:hypothetical protein B0H14DRAFT_1099780 [Mycena olivaceomarginata]